MRLTNELDVDAAPDATWQVLLDVPRVARALPGATIQPDAEAGAWRGAMKVKLGPVTAEYSGSARLLDADDDERVARYRVEGREARGQGTAAATITARVAGGSDGGSGAHVVVETDLQVTGRQAQLGQGIMEDVAGAILAEFAQRLARELRGEAPDGDQHGALDVSGAVRGAVLARAVPVAAGVAAGVAIGLALGRAVWRR